MKQLSAWAWQAARSLSKQEATERVLFFESELLLYLTSDSLWLVYCWPNSIKTGFRLVYSQSAPLQLDRIRKKQDGLIVSLHSHLGTYSVTISFPSKAQSIFRYTTSFTPQQELLMAFAPRELLCFTKAWEPLASGTIHSSQVGNRSGALYFSLDQPKTGAVFYFQNLTALNTYFEQTKTAGTDTVGGTWPEIGFALPATMQEALIADQEYILTDAFVLLTNQIPKKATEVCITYLDYLAQIYLCLPKPEVESHPWLAIAENGLSDIQSHPGCWTYAAGHHFLNAYVSDYKSPPEVMVQLAVLLPLYEYMEWKGNESHPVIQKLKDGLELFYKKEIGTIVRWLPQLESNLDYSEEQKKPDVMDAWYLHHPLMNLARIVAKGHNELKDLLLRSIPYVIKVAQRFKYNWPVFYEMDTLHIVKAETAEGEGGEKDVPGTYADLMLKIFEITKEQKYINEAKRSVKQLEDLGFDIFYQANNTAFSAAGLLKLYKITGEKHYLDLSYSCLAAIFKNVQLWDCNYGNGKFRPSFFAIYPLKDAPYTAAYEEQEVYAALYYYYQELKDLDEALPAVKLLIAEFIRYAISRVPYYFPPMLPQEMLSKEPKTGEIDPTLWVALEDLGDGWEEAGTIGQEVYGAGIAFGIIPRQHFKIPDEDFVLFIDYPLDRYVCKNKTVEFVVGGAFDTSCQFSVILNGDKTNRFKLQAKRANEWTLIKADSANKERITYQLMANQHIKLTWD